MCIYCWIFYKYHLKLWRKKITSSQSPQWTQLWGNILVSRLCKTPRGARVHRIKWRLSFFKIITRFWIRNINRKVSSHHNACGTSIRKKTANRNIFVFGIYSSLRDIWNYWKTITIPFEFILKSPLALIERPLNYNQTQDKLLLWFIYYISLNFKLECGAFIMLFTEVEFLIRN